MSCNIKYIKKITTFIIVLLVVIPFQSLLAKTPDGFTPAVEDVCDVLIGRTPGLYGLCVAYCEAQDCDIAAARSAQCKRTPPSKPILRNYNKKMRVGDPAMPCLAPPQAECPCITEEEGVITSWNQCTIDNNNDLLAEGNLGETFSIETFANGGGICTFAYEIERSANLDAGQVQACTALIEQEVMADGISCVQEPEF